ncbi:MAG: hypothetical protein NTU44_05365 [Bacteroidetes bacterium]|nr:hypothetical protein [Bacteroidota bacterium]
MAPNVQPYLTLSAGNFEAGAWATSNFNGTYRELAFWVAYSYKNFTLSVNDYLWPPYIDSLRFFNYDNETAGHFLDGSLEWDGPESFPLELSVSTLFYGPDDKFDHYDPATKTSYYKNQYSTNLEACYPDFNFSGLYR